MPGEGPVESESLVDQVVLMNDAEMVCLFFHLRMVMMLEGKDVKLGGGHR
jgi:hypothetical protein